MLYLLDRANARERLKQAHSAAADVLICKTILDHIIAKTGVESFEGLYALSEIARIPTVWAFGKHKGMKIGETPKDYIAWMLRQEIDEYLRQALTGRKPDPQLL
jgi:exodeoxyribonuclease X